MTCLTWGSMYFLAAKRKIQRAIRYQCNTCYVCRALRVLSTVKGLITTNSYTQTVYDRTNEGQWHMFILVNVRHGCRWICYGCQNLIAPKKLYSTNKGHYSTFIRSVIAFIQSFIHSFIHSFVSSFARTFVRSSVRSFVHPFVCSFVHSFVRSFARTFVRSFVRSFVCPSVRYIHSSWCSMRNCSAIAASTLTGGSLSSVKHNLAQSTALARLASSWNEISPKLCRTQQA